MTMVLTIAVGVGGQEGAFSMVTDHQLSSSAQILLTSFSKVHLLAG